MRLSLFVALVLFGTAGVAEAQERVDRRDLGGDGAESAPESGAAPMVVLERARADYQAARYDSCSRLLTDLFGVEARPFEDTSVSDEARHYAFACALLVGDDALATHHVEAGLLENPAMDNPDPLVFRPQVVEGFIEIRVAGQEARRAAAERQLEAQARNALARKQVEIERAELLAELKGLAAEEREVQKNSRWMAAVPFGVGQFQNRQEALGWLFLSAEVALAGVALGATIVELDLHSQAYALQRDGQLVDVQALNADLAAAQTAQMVGGWGLLFTALVGVLEAQLSYEPQFVDPPRTRVLPRELRELQISRPSPRGLHPRVDGSVSGPRVGFEFVF